MNVINIPYKIDGETFLKLCLMSDCLSCSRKTTDDMKAYRKEYYSKNKFRYSRKKSHGLKNFTKKEMKEYRHQYYEENKEEIKRKVKEYYKENREVINEKNKKRNKLNQKKYYENYKKKLWKNIIK